MKHELRTCGNYAAYSEKYNVSYCGWMDFHDDKDSGVPLVARPWFIIEVIYADPNAILVHRENAKYIGVVPLKGSIIQFNTRKLHALLPKEIAVECIERNSTVPQRKLFKNLNVYTSDSEPRLIWRFINETT
jgi:hypothetical protein